MNTVRDSAQAEPGAGVRVATYNTLDLWRHHANPDEVARHDRVERVIAELVDEHQVDVLALQELWTGPGRARCPELEALAERVGMTVWHFRDDDQDHPAVGLSPHGHNVALLWRPDRVRAMPGGFRAYETDGMFHCLITQLLQVRGSDGRWYRHRFGAGHRTPFGNSAGRADECERVVTALTRPRGTRPPGLVGEDWNTVGADRQAGGGFYDPDPYAGEHQHEGPCTPGTGPDGGGCARQTGVAWRSANIHQCDWEYDDRGRRVRWWANRRPGDVLWSGGLVDAAAALTAPWRATTGHWPTDPFGARRPDGVRVTEDVVPALLDHQVVDTELTRSASDHLPVVVTYDPAAVVDAGRHLAAE